MASEPKNVFARVQPLAATTTNTVETVKVVPERAPTSAFNRPPKVGIVMSAPTAAAPTIIAILSQHSQKVIDACDKFLKNTEPKIVFKGAVQRKQIIISELEIAQKFPQLTESQLTQVGDLIRSTVITSTEQVSEFGLQYQKNLSKLLDKELSFIQGSAIDGAKSDMGLIVSQLSNFDIDSTSLLQRAKSIFTNKFEQFKSNYSKLEATIISLDNKIPSLKSLRSLIEDNANVSKEIESNVAVYIAAATFLLNFADDTYKAVFEKRIIDLTTCRATIESNKLQRKMTIDVINSMIENVNSVIGTELPLWKTNVISLLSTKTSSVSLQDLVNKQSEIINKLTK